MKFFLNDIENSIAQYFRTPFDNVELKKAIESVLNADTLKKIDNNTFLLVLFLMSREGKGGKS